MIIPISGIIGSDVKPSDVRAGLDKAGGQEVEVQISSPGGVVFDALEIYNLLARYLGRVTTHLMGMAASAASYIAMAGKRVVAEANTVFMIHGAQGVAVGDHQTMTKMAGILDGFSGILAKAYAAKAGKPLEEIRGLMDQETYYFGQEALEAGFVDEVLGGGSVSNRASALAEAHASVATATARCRDLWPADAAERAVALIGGIPQPRPREEELLAKIRVHGWRNEDLAYAFKWGFSLEQIARYGCEQKTGRGV